jgi:hypothetical protein
VGNPDNLVNPASFFLDRIHRIYRITGLRFFSESGLLTTEHRFSLGLPYRLLVVAVFASVFVTTGQAADKNSGAREGYENAQADARQFAISLSGKSPEDLIRLFLPDGRKQYGGYDYFYRYFVNEAIIGELKSRGEKANDALKKHVNDHVPLWQPINGPPSYNIGEVCRGLLQKK